MTASLAPAATSQQPPKQKKPRGKSSFLVLRELARSSEGSTEGQRYVEMASTISMKHARASLEDTKDDFDYLIVCVRERGSVKVESVATRKVAK